MKTKLFFLGKKLKNEKLVKLLDELEIDKKILNVQEKHWETESVKGKYLIEKEKDLYKVDLSVIRWDYHECDGSLPQVEERNITLDKVYERKEYNYNFKLNHNPIENVPKDL